jgi:Ca2+-binding EF-hand superfamily protein
MLTTCLYRGSYVTFQAFDTNKDGYLSIDELRAALYSARSCATPAELNATFSAIAPSQDQDLPVAQERFTSASHTSPPASAATDSTTYATTSATALVSPFALPQQQQQEVDRGRLQSTALSPTKSSGGRSYDLDPHTSSCYSLPAEADLEAEISAELEALMQQLEADSLGRVKYAAFRDMLRRSCSQGLYGCSSSSSSLPGSSCRGGVLLQPGGRSASAHVG